MMGSSLPPQFVSAEMSTIQKEVEEYFKESQRRAGSAPQW